MGPVAVGCGLLLMGLGIGFFVGTGTEHFTSLIPAFFGVVLVVLGLLARKERLRMHVMHAAAALGLVGIIMPLVRLVPALSSGKYDAYAAWEQGIMAFICLGFVLLCVRSFVVARVLRKRAEKEQAPLR